MRRMTQSYGPKVLARLGAASLKEVLDAGEQPRTFCRLRRSRLIGGGHRRQGPLEQCGVDEGAGSGSILHLQLGEDVPHVISNRVPGYYELVGDLLVAEARCRQT